LLPVAIQSFVMQNLFAEQLKALRAASLERHLREVSSSQGPEIEIDGRRFVNFSSSDYLGLANDPQLRKAAVAAVDEFGVGAGASRLISACSAIFPWVGGGEQAALDLARAFQNEGFLIPAIRYPTVAKGSARLRLTVTAAHQKYQVRALCDAIRTLSAGVPVATRR
jgi:7-keto-8-aminopelargonate synthetase-like enzyme